MRSLLLASLLLASTAAHSATVVTADRYLDVNSGKYVEHPAIFIGDDGRITSIGDARSVRWGAEVKHIDLSGKTLLPGLIDMHTHLGPANIGGYRFLEYTDSFWPVVATSTARDMLDGGFTTMRVVGSGAWTDVGLKQAIEEIKALGIDIEIDDFGSGHASIVSLLELSPKRLKIDRRLVQPLLGSTAQQSLVHSIIDIGKVRGIETVAEGVETLEHAELLRRLGCHVLQGYALARPMPAEDFLAFAKARSWMPAERLSPAKAS